VYFAPGFPPGFSLTYGLYAPGPGEIVLSDSFCIFSSYVTRTSPRGAVPILSKHLKNSIKKVNRIDPKDFLFFSLGV